MGSSYCAVFVTTLVIKNLSITNNDMVGLAVYHTAVVVNGTSVFHNKLALMEVDWLCMETPILCFTKILSLISQITVQSTEEEPFLLNAPCFFQYFDHTNPLLETADTALFG